MNVSEYYLMHSTSTAMNDNVFVLTQCMRVVNLHEMCSICRAHSGIGNELPSASGIDEWLVIS